MRNFWLFQYWIKFVYSFHINFVCLFGKYQHFGEMPNYKKKKLKSLLIFFKWNFVFPWFFLLLLFVFNVDELKWLFIVLFVCFVDWQVQVFWNWGQSLVITRFWEFPVSCFETVHFLEISVEFSLFWSFQNETKEPFY